jgi:predicted AlkP superfamily phosphohydrolase/phosphomutase
MTEAPAHRSVLIGLDGATFAILDQLMSADVMPFLAEFVRRGVRSVLQSTRHPLTPIAWTTLTTGRLPGNHGVFDFVRIDRQGDHPGYVLGTSADVQAETIWSLASRNGRSVTTLNFPCMFPAPRVNGFVVPGFVPWRYLARAVYPRELYARLKTLSAFNARDLALDWDIERKALQGLPAEEFETWIKFHMAREQQWFQIARLLMREEPCDLTAILFDGVDKIQHLCYYLIDAELAAAHPSAWAQRVRALCLSYFRQLDSFIRDLVTLAGAEAQVFLASDHGFQAAGDHIFYANVWLQQNGYLQWAADAPVDNDGRLTLDGHAGTDSLIDWSRTIAYALTAAGNGIYIRRSTESNPRGVAENEYANLRQRLIDGLLDFKNPVTHEPVLQEVLTSEEAFPGQYQAQAPDLTLVLRDRSFLSVLRADSPWQPRRMPYGTHHPDGIFIAGGPALRAGVQLSPSSIVQITPTLLYSLGIPLPEALDGEPLLAAFEPSFVAANAVQVESAGADRQVIAAEQPAFDADAEREVLDRLRALGYLE